MKDVINVSDEAMFSLVVFAGKSIFRQINASECRGVLLSALNYIKSKRNAHLSEDDVEQVVTAIEQARLPGGFLTRIIHSAHIKQFRKRRSSRPQKPQVQASDNAPQCPRCKNVNLVQRSANSSQTCGQYVLGLPELSIMPSTTTALIYGSHRKYKYQQGQVPNKFDSFTGRK